MNKLFIAMLIVFCHVSFAAQTMTFPDACVQGQSIVIAAVGDVLLHSPLQTKAEKKGFESLWEETIKYIKNADIAYANLEGPIAFNIRRKGENAVYTSFPYFNYPPSLAWALKNSGFHIVSTANNHALDRFSIGIDKTIEALNKAGVNHVGTRTRGSSQPWFSIVEKNNVKVAWIACAENTNGNSDDYHQVLHCYKKKDREEILNMIRNLKSQADAIIITPHWGEEYHQQPGGDQKEFAYQMLEAGATAVIGSHPHVMQPLQKYMTKDGRSTVILYSLGNFVSYQGRPLQRSTIILLLGLTKTSHGTVINGVRFVPLYMQNRSGLFGIRLAPASLNDSQLNKIFSRVMPMGNVTYSQSFITNPECQKSQVN